jgi:hypothetical protein
MGGYVISNGTLFYKIKLDVEAPTDFIQTLLWGATICENYKYLENQGAANLGIKSTMEGS